MNAEIEVLPPRLGGSFYDGRDDRQLVRCPSCRLPADVLFGDHLGDKRCQRIGRDNAAAAQRMQLGGPRR